METTTKRRNKSNNYCCVPQCNSYYSEGLSFHKFPKDKPLQNEWRRVLKMGKSIKDHMQVCSKHFRKEDYFFNRALTSKKHSLKRGTIPSCSLPETSFPINRNEDRAGRIKNQQLLKDRNTQVEETSKESVGTVLNDQSLEDPTDSEAAHILLSFSRNDTFDGFICPDNTSEQMEDKVFQDKGIQVNTLDDFIKEDIISKIVTTENRLRVLTGINSFALLDVFIKAVSKFDLGKSILSVKHKIMLTMMRLKLDIPFAALGIFFNVSASTAQATFKSTVKTLSLLLKPTVRFPPKEEIQKNIPKCFEQYSATRIVLNCTEIAVQKSKCLNCRVRLYSNYKGRHTIKFLIGAAPSGLITYVSKPYGGRASDKAIFNKENLILKFDPGDAIMVDRGFLIEKECESNNIKLIRPPFRRKKRLFTEEEAIETADIVRARVHVERVIQRIKLFRIFRNVVPFTMLPFINDAMIIIAAVTNLSMPILGKDQFL